MKNLNYLWLASGLCLMASCSSEAPDVNQNLPEEGDGNSYFIKVALNTLSTRGGDAYNTGIENAAFLFYDENGNYISTRYVGGSAGSQGATDQGTQWLTDPTHNGTGKKCAVIKLARNPQYVVCVVNAEKEDFTGDNIDTRSVSDFVNGTNLIMSSSTYWDDNNVVTYRAEIDKNTMIFDSEDAAKNAASDQAVVLKVEPIVAKVEVKNGLALTDGAIKPLEDITHKEVEGENEVIKTDIANKLKDQVKDAKVSFKPEMVCLTATNSKGFTMKKLPTYTDDLENWNLTGRSLWVGSTTGNIEYAKLSGLTGNDYAYPTGDSSQFFFPFENNKSNQVEQTSVVVAGKYTVTDKDGNSLAADDGTFYLIGVGDSFTVYSDEKVVIEKLGGDPAKDKLEEVRENADDQKTWTGWMTVKGKNSPLKCIKYSGGYGYYAKPIQLINNNKSTNKIVRNVWYSLTIKTIFGMGVGIPEPGREIIPINPPSPNDEDYFMHIAINVQEWWKTNQNVEWGK